MENLNVLFEPMRYTYFTKMLSQFHLFPLDNYRLLIHNILFLGGGILNIGIAIFVLVSTRKARTITATAFALSSLAVAVFQISQLFGVNAPDPVTSRNILMFNLTDIFIGIFMAHWFIGLIGKLREERRNLIIIYASGIALFVFFLIFPRTFLVDSVHKLYLPYYYEPGRLYIVMFIWFLAVSVYHFYKLARAFFAEQNPITRNRLKYALLAMTYAYVFGTTAFLLVFNIPFDPALSSVFGLYPLFLTYAILRYQLLEVRVIVERAFLYAAIIAVLIALIIFANYSNSYLEEVAPGFPALIVPIASALATFFVGFFAWRKFRENDVLKYEFITVIAHKFRTPLTESKWAVEDLLEKNTDPKDRTNIEQIRISNEKLVKLTGALIDLANAESGVDSSYAFGKVSLVTVVGEAAAPFLQRFREKGIAFSIENPAAGFEVNADRERLVYAVQTLLENSLAYTEKEGTVTVALVRSGRKALVVVTDTGIGIAAEDLPRIFSRFYRTHDARTADTEGFGIGLYLARSIVRRHGGKLEAFSDGKAKGSTFTIILPVA